MDDPRENCPWKCKHCLCYDGEIKRLTAENERLMAVYVSAIKHRPRDQSGELRRAIAAVKEDK